MRYVKGTAVALCATVLAGGCAPTLAVSIGDKSPVTQTTDQTTIIAGNKAEQPKDRNGLTRLIGNDGRRQ